MKRQPVLISLIIFSVMCFSSCKYGFQEAFWRNNEVNQRSPSVRDLNDTKYVPTLPGDKFSVIFMSDVHFGRGDQRVETFFNKITEIKKSFEDEYPLGFAICAGDSVETGLEEYYDQYVEFCKQLKDKFSIQMYSAVGNHDLYNSGFNFWEKKVYPYTSSYTFKTKPASPEGQPISWYFLDTGSSTLGKKQFESFKQTSLADPDPKIVVSHCPIYNGGVLYFTLQNETERNQLMSIFAQSKTLAVLEGHSHKYNKFCFEGYFTEHLTGSLLDNAVFSVLLIDLTTGSYKYEKYDY